MIEKIKDSFVWEIEKRFKNPFLWAFLISWIFWNWKFIYVILFIDQQYVSLLPKLEQSSAFITKLEYLLKLDIINLQNCLFYPLLSSIVFVVFVEWWTTFMLIILNNVKNNISWHEKLTVGQSQELKNNQIEERRKNQELLSSANDEIFSLQNKISEDEGTIDQKVNEKLKIFENKNIERIKELEDDLRKSEIISSERLEKNKNLDIENKNLNTVIDNLKWIEQTFNKRIENQLKEIWELMNENRELKERLSKIDKPLAEKYKIEYEEFKKSYFFPRFDDFIDLIESHPYDLNNQFYWKDIKFLEVKWIIEKGDDRVGNELYRFTNKWDKFVEYFLDSYNWAEIKKQGLKIKSKEKINIDDIPF